MALTLTETAVKQVKQLMETQSLGNVYLRMGITGGGCSGLSDQLEFDTEVGPHDKTFDSDGVQVVCDKKSYLYLTGTTLSVPALTGIIMTMGVATANSILVVSFARSQLQKGTTAAIAALEAGSTRLRPVLMTAFAMIVGMLPMAIGIGEGAEQNAPLGKAVIGGLLFATVSTLVFVPIVFAALRRLAERRQHDQEHHVPSNQLPEFSTN